MPDLVRIPWQTYYWLTPHTLAYLIAASKRLGYNGTTTGLMLYAADPRGLLSAWRSYEQQKLLYEAFLNGGTAASNPDTGQRSHMRGAAFDLARTDFSAQNACRAVGLIRDTEESWHWNDPNWASMPIIYTHTAVAGGGTEPLEDLRKKADVMYRMILTKRGTTTAANLYDMFTDYATLTGVTWAEADAHKQGQNGEATLGSIDGTNADNAELVAATRKLWARIQAANITGIRAAVGQAGPADIDEAALAAALAPLLAASLSGVTEAELLAALQANGTAIVAAIVPKIPTTFTAG